MKGSVFGGGLWGEGPSRGSAFLGLVGRGSQAHSVRRESCDGSQQSRACGWLVRRGACRRTPCAERAVMAHSSPEPAARWCGGGLWGEACSERCLGWAGPAGWLRESGSRLPQSKAFGWLVRGVAGSRGTALLSESRREAWWNLVRRGRCNARDRAGEQQRAWQEGQFHRGLRGNAQE